MEVQHGQQSGEYLKSSSSINKVLTLKSLISEILLLNSAYDCMPINSVMCSIDKSVSLIKAINIFVNEGVDQLLVWDQGESKWVWMLTVADTVRFLLYAFKCTTKRVPLNFEHFEIANQQEIPPLTKKQLEETMVVLSQKTLSQILLEFQLNQRGKGNFIRIKSVVKEAKLSYLVLTMITERIHRIVIEDIDSKMMISVISFKDILLFLLRIANQSQTEVYSRIPIKSFLETNSLKEKFIYKDQKLIEAFRMMVEVHRSIWINVVDEDMRFCGIVFRRDFKDILKEWNLNQLWMTVGEFIQYKTQQSTSRIPQYRFFDLEDTTREILWKIVMSRKNLIICVDKNNGRVISTIGLMELFNLYVQYS